MYDTNPNMLEELKSIFKDQRLAKHLYQTIGNDPFTVDVDSTGFYVLYVKGGLTSRNGYEIRAVPGMDANSVVINRRLEK